MKYSLFFLFAALFWNNDLAGQPVDTGPVMSEIAFYSDVMVNAVGDEHRARAYEKLNEALDTFLHIPGSYNLPLDSIPWIKVLQGETFRLVTYQWKVNNEEYKYGGFLQWPDKIVALKDNRPFLNGSLRSTYSPTSWYGALYYDIMPFEREGNTYYLLLGFNAENSVLNTKVADVLDLTGNEIKFGIPVFIGKEDPMTRLMVTYADVSTVHIRYDAGYGGLVHDHIENLQGVGANGESLPVSDGSLEGWKLKDGEWVYEEEAFDVQVEAPPMTEERKERKEEKDILGRPKKE